MRAVMHRVESFQGFLVERVQFGNSQHIGFGQFTTPAARSRTALSKRLKKNDTQVKSFSRADLGTSASGKI
jgi:hypothetical protein